MPRRLCVPHTNLHNKSYSTQSYIKTEPLCTPVHPYTRNKLDKSSVKRCVFRVRQKAAYESVSLILTGDYSKCLVRRLKKRVDRTELLFEGQRRTWLLMTVVMTLGSSDAECDKVSVRYGGERWWKILCMVVATLKIIGRGPASEKLLWPKLHDLRCDRSVKLYECEFDSCVKPNENR